jgi:hypothetical protein
MVSPFQDWIFQFSQIVAKARVKGSAHVSA